MPKKWYEDPILFVGLALAGAGTYVALAADRTKTITGTVTDVFTRGSKLTSSHLGVDGVIVEDPMSLIAIASMSVPGLDGDSYSLARMIRSEGADQGEVRGHVALNDLRSLGWQSLQYLLTYSTASWAIGKYGQQHSVYEDTDGEHPQTRRYSTSKDPYQGDAMMALKVISDHQRGIDPTGGAVKFFDRNAASAEQYDKVLVSWMSDGLIAYTLPQYGSNLVLFRKG